jgi:hypothetical protein
VFQEEVSFVADDYSRSGLQDFVVNLNVLAVDLLGEYKGE